MIQPNHCPNLRLPFIGLICIGSLLTTMLLPASTAFVLQWQHTKQLMTNKRIAVPFYSTNDDNVMGDVLAATKNSTVTTIASSSVVGDDFLDSVARTGMKDLDELQVGDMIVAKTDVPSLRIWCGSGYEIMAMYTKGVNKDTGLVEKIPLEMFGGGGGTNMNDNTQRRMGGYTKYLEVYNPRHHQERGPVVVSPEEIGLATLKSELNEAVLLAIPGFFWVFVASAFANTYTDRYGGDFWDAFFRT